MQGKRNVRVDGTLLKKTLNAMKQSNKGKTNKSRESK